MPITEEGRLLIENYIVRLRKEIETDKELIIVLREILDGTPVLEPELEFTVWRILAEPYLNIRFQPSLHATDIGNVYPQSTVDVLEYYGGLQGDENDLWGRIERGWIALELGVNIFAEKVE